MDQPTLPLTGGCACGAVRFEVSEPLTFAIYCHCTRCQRRSGTGFAVSAQTVPGSFKVTAGEDLVSAWSSPEGGWEKVFCSRCGGHVWAGDPENPELVRVRMGAIDGGEPGVRPSAHQFTDYAPAWSPVPDDGLPRFPERMPAPAPPAA